MQSIPHRLLAISLTWLLWPSIANAQLICDPDSARLILNAGSILDRQMQAGSREFDTGVNAPEVVLDCLSTQGTETKIENCSDGVQKIFLTWHSTGGRVEATCLAGTYVQPSQAPPTEPEDLPANGLGNEGSGYSEGN